MQWLYNVRMHAYKYMNVYILYVHIYLCIYVYEYLYIPFQEPHKLAETWQFMRFVTFPKFSFFLTL